MVIAEGSPAPHGLRPADVRRDLRGIADLLAEAFSGELDEVGWRVIRELRRWSRLGWLLRGLEVFLPPGERFAPGYVWVEEGRIVGYTMVRRLRPGSTGWLIANVAVAPDFRRRGIARALVSACLDYARAHGARWAVLQVRADNLPALRLYQGLGFVEIGRIRIWRREHLSPPEPTPVPGFHVRPARPTRDLSALLDLVRMAESPALRLFEPFEGLSAWPPGWPFRWRPRPLWLLETESGDPQALAAWVRREGIPTLRLFRRPQTVPSPPLQWLLALALAEIAPGPPLMAVTGEEPDLAAALMAAGFHPVRTLIGMRRDLAPEGWGDAG